MSIISPIKLLKLISAILINEVYAVFRLSIKQYPWIKKKVYSIISHHGNEIKTML